MPEFMVDLRAKAGVSVRPVEFTILTAARTGEAIGARWSEIDLDKGLWTVPGERMKSGRERRVPLSDRALAIISQLPDGEFLFAGRKPHKPLSQQAMLELMRDMRGKGATVHGFRSTFRDWAAKQTSYPKELCEIALDYALSDKMRRPTDMMEKRRQSPTRRPHIARASFHRRRPDRKTATRRALSSHAAAHIFVPPKPLHDHVAIDAASAAANLTGFRCLAANLHHVRQPGHTARFCLR